MYKGIGYQIVLFFVFFVLGIFCALVFDTFRVSERFKKSNIFLSAVKDILFWLIITVMMFAICLRFNNGEIRFFMFAGIILGALIYFKTISKLVLNALFFVFNMLKKAVHLFLKVLFLPFKLLLKILNKPLFIALSLSKKSIVRLVEKIKFKLKILKKFKR